MTPPSHEVSKGPDLEVLRRAEPRSSGRARTPFAARATVVVIVVGLAGLAYALLEPLVFPAREVRLAEVRQGGAGHSASRTVSTRVEAAGWIEASPYPVSVRPLVVGIVESMDVLEGRTVEKGKTLIAVLRNLELENALEEVRSDRALRQAESDEAQAELYVARALLEQRLAARGAQASAKGYVDTATAQVAAAQAMRVAAQAEAQEAHVDVQAQEDLAQAGGNAPAALLRARARHEAALARHEAARAAVDVALKELEQRNAERVIAEEGVADPRDLDGDVRIATARASLRAAALALADTRLALAQRNVDHLRVLSPATGVVLRVDSAPGAMVGPTGDFKGEAEGKGSTGLLNRSTGVLVTLYDPAHLQVRVDVPYAEVVGIGAGDPVELEPHALPGTTIRGQVDRLVHEGDINKAMLQVKVLIQDPDARLRPEMLAKARFVRKAQPGTQASGEMQLLIPTEAMQGDAVFVLDPRGGGRARRVAVQVLGVEGAWTAVQGPLGLSSKVILDEVKDGERVVGVKQ